MKYTLKGINAEELSFKQNRVRLAPNAKFAIKPQFGRQVRKVKDNDKLMFVALSVKIEGTENEPTPYDIHLTIVGGFDVEDVVPGSEEERQFIIEATSILFPYLRASVSNLTASAYAPPLNLPVISGPIFPEDRDLYEFTIRDDIN